jgi:hypothetical protein
MKHHDPKQIEDDCGQSGTGNRRDIDRGGFLLEIQVGQIFADAGRLKPPFTGEMGILLADEIQYAGKTAFTRAPIR